MGKIQLDKIFSQYIRLRDSTQGEYGNCISCGKLIHWKQGHCGHFINRKHMSLRFNEINCNLQCISCNTFDEGNLEGYRRGLVKKHGPDIIDKLYALKNQVCKISNVEYLIAERYYKQEVKRIVYEKGIEL
jgi:hypothetical protein